MITVMMTDDCISGASFLIPYVIMLVVVGLPAMLIELSAGQYARVGANKVFGRMVPAFKVIHIHTFFKVSNLLHRVWATECYW